MVSFITHPSTAAHGGGWFSGQLFVEEMLDALPDAWRGDFLEGAQEAAEWLQSVVQTEAAAVPGWRDLAPYIAVWTEGSDLVVGVRGSQAQVDAAKALEYGDPNTPMRPLLRSALLRSMHDLNVRIDHALDYSGSVKA